MSARRLLGRGDVERLLVDNGLSPRKSLGQNFVIDPNTIDRIVRLARVGEGDHVVEIGAGLGSLTLALEATGAHIVAFEIDARLAAVLRRSVGESVSVVEADAMSADIETVLREARRGATDDANITTPPWVLVANLPYNIATPLILSVLENVPSVERMVVMVQREVAERFVAGPGSRIYGGVSVRIAYFATTKMVGKVPREVFYPRPHVDSALVEIARRADVAVDPAESSYEEIAALVRAGFSQRRKMLRRSLAALVSEEMFACAGIKPTDRAESLDVAAWGKLAECRRTISSSLPPS